jgi:hypothetical protein
MWNITSNNVQLAKDRLQLRRAEIETRYAEERTALDGEFAIIESLERAASEFMLRHSRENGAIAAEPAAEIDVPSADEESYSRETPENGLEAAASIDPPGSGEVGGSLERIPHPEAEIDPGGGESGGSLDILKPGSRWRLYRGNRPTDPEGIASDASPARGE